MATLKTITITLGEEMFSPHRFEGFRVGPLMVSAELKEGETIVEAVKSINVMIAPAWDELFVLARDKYHEHHMAKE